MHEFHALHRRTTEIAGDVLVADLTRISEQVFAPLLAGDYYVHAWLQRWLAKIPAYLDWQLAREQAGWLWQDGEIARRREFALAGQRAITLYGRLDRIDRSGDEYAVLDYKTSAAQGLKDKIRQGDEDVQLAAYVLLAQEQVRQTAFVSLDADSIDTIGLPDDAAMAAAARCGERLVTLFEQLHEHAPLPANGMEQVCRHCDMRGLCRRDHWTTLA